MFCLCVSPGTAKNGFFKLTSLRLELKTNYDDNILRYSQRDIDRFIEGTEYHPSRLTTHDDWKNDFRLKLYLDGPRIFRQQLKIRYFGKFSSFYRNPFNNYTTHTLLLSQRLVRRLEVHFKYFYMPDYYLREYRDHDLDEYQGCSFDNHQARLGLTCKPLKYTEITLQAEYEQLYYNEYFTEYDSESWLYELELSRRFGRNTTLVFSCGFKISDNIGYIASQASVLNPLVQEDTEYGDSSYEADIYQLEIRHRCRKLMGEDTDLKFQYKLRRRYYSTGNSLEEDPFHADRFDMRHRLIFEISRDILDNLEASLSYTHEWRETESDNQLTEDIKEFRQNLISFSLTFKLY